MAIECDIILSWDATPGELRAVGAALWRWRTSTEVEADVFPRLDSQTRADLIAGVFPGANRTQQRFDGCGVHFSVCNESAPDRREPIEDLRRELPSAGIEDVLIDSTRWHGVAAVESADAPEPGAGRTRACL